jgi:homotetrameric NADPH-dependent glutamate synthase
MQTPQFFLRVIEMERSVWKRVPVREVPPEERRLDFREVNLGYTPEDAIAEAARCIFCRRPFCVEACPFHQDVPGYLARIKEGDFVGAMQVILRDNPLPAVCGRVCPHPCESVCPRGKKGDPIAIAWLKRAAADYAPDVKFPEPAPPTGFRVAIVGAGPAGLTAAWQLRLKGHSVTVYEAMDYPGGMLYFGIPIFRLPREALKADLERLNALGIEWRLGVKLGEHITLDELQQQYDAVLLAIGALKQRWMNIPGEDLDGVWHVIDFVKAVNLGNPPDLKGKRVAVIGGGFSAIDAVRMAIRLGAEAFILYRRDREQMPASQEEVRHAEEEGVTIHFLVNPTRFIGENGRLVAIEVQRQQLGEPDESGRPRPVPIPGSEFIVPADVVIEAISQEVDLSHLPEPLRGRRVIAVNSENLQTSIPGVFAAGDAVTGPWDVPNAIASGHKAAQAIHEWLCSK